MDKNNTDEVSEEKKETSKENATDPTTIKTEYEFSESAKRLFEAARQPTPKKEPTITFLQDDEGLDGKDPDPNNLFDPEKVKAAVEKPIVEDPKDVKRRLESAKTSATVYVGLLDILSQQLFGFLNRMYTKKKIGKEAYLEASVLCKKIDRGNAVLDEFELPMQAKIRIIARMQARIDELEFSDKDYETIEAPLADILKDLPGFELSPKWALMIATANVLLPRTIEIFED